MRVFTFLKSLVWEYRAHRDDQSAFTFLISKYMGYGRYNSRQVFLNNYVGAYWRQVGKFINENFVTF